MQAKRKTNTPTFVKMKGPCAPNRREAEDFVQNCFAHAYEANVSEFMPTLMGLRDHQGDLLAVLGLRQAQETSQDTALYLEHYLTQPVEHALAKALSLKTPLDRSKLIEVGNFSVGSAGGGRWLITALTAYLHGANQQWAVFTCGPELQNAFKRLGVELIDLGEANPALLPDTDNNQWGRYYDKKPRVMAANVAQSYHALRDFQQRENALYIMWNAAHQAGQLAA